MAAIWLLPSFDCGTLFFWANGKKIKLRMDLSRHTRGTELWPFTEKSSEWRTGTGGLGRETPPDPRARIFSSREMKCI